MERRFSVKLTALAVVLTSIFAYGCADGQMDSAGAKSTTDHIVCYSGGVKIYEGMSIGRIKSYGSTKSYAFTDREDGLVKRASGDCIVTRQEEVD